MPFAGAFALDNLQKYAEMLRQRKLLEEETAFKRMQAQDVMRGQQETRDLSRRAQDLNEAFRRDTLESQAFDREAKREEAIDENAIAGDPISDERFAQMEKFGRGGSARSVTRSIPQVELTGAAPLGQTGSLRTIGSAESRTAREHRGGSKYLSAQTLRAQQDAAAAERTQSAQASAAERAQSAQASAMERAQLQGGIQRDIAEGRNQTAQLIAGMQQAGRAERDAEKRETAEKQRTQSQSLALQAIDRDLDRLTALGQFDKTSGQFQGLRPDVAPLFGLSTGRVTKFIPGTAGAASNAALNQITSDAVVNTILEMKAQSKTGATGFGQLNLKELDIIQSAATKVKDRNIPPETAAAELKDMIQRLRQIRNTTASGGATPAPNQGGGESGGFRVVGSRPK